MTTTSTIHLGLLLAACAPALAAAQPAPSGTLAFAPEAPAPGVRVEVRYQSPAGAPRMVLRARLRTPGDQDAYLGALGSETRRVAELVRGGDGVLRGSFVWPDSAVYALFAVEAPDGSVVDTRGNQGWELLARGAAGHPSAEALDQRARDLTLRNPLLGLATARERVRLYPDAPESWLQLWWFEGYAQGKHEEDTTQLPARRARLAELTRALNARPSLTGAELGAMMDMARGLADTAAARGWEARLLREHPRHRSAVPSRMRAAMAGDASARLQALERLWAELGATDDYLLMVGTGSALDGGDVDAVLRWTERLRVHVPLLEPNSRAARALIERPATREEGMRRVRSLLTRLAEARDADRDLFRSTTRQRDRDAEKQAELLAALGEALHASGSPAAALDTLGRASSRAAGAPLLHRIADAQIAAGDTAGAVRTWARVAPGAGDTLVDTVRERAGRHFQARRWAADVAVARAELAARVRRAQVSRPLPAGLRLADGAPAVVVFARSGCGFSIRALPEVQRLADELARGGVRTVLVTDDAPTPDAESFFRQRGFTGPIVHDPTRATHSAFGSANTPEYFVVDAAGTIRFEYSSLAELPGQVAALSN
ncbi:MAG TPA: redoxin domain-containing protein [Longimicrobium sp.]|jgi:hypothetical protein